MFFTFKSYKFVYNLSHIHHSGSTADCSFHHGCIWSFNRHLNILNLFIYYFNTNLFMPKIYTLLSTHSMYCLLSAYTRNLYVPTHSLPESADPQGLVTSNTPSHGKSSCHVLQNKGQPSNILYFFNTKDLHTTFLPSVLRKKSFSTAIFEILQG